MSLTSLNIAAVSPRGGPTGATIIITGSNFGASQGQVIFNPEGGAGGPQPATISAWSDSSITLAVPAGLTPNQHVTLQVINAAMNDSVSVPFWLPALVSGPADTTGYAYPGLEANGPAQDTNDPRVLKAADFNRLLDRITRLQVDPLITPTTAQVVFTLSRSPSDPTAVALEIDEAVYRPQGGFITVGGAGNRTVTWLNVPFSLTSANKVIPVYPVGV